MSSGKFVIYTRKGAADKYCYLSHFDYDDSARKRSGRRTAMLHRIMASVMGWQTRVHDYRDASFMVREKTAEDGPRVKGKVLNLAMELAKLPAAPVPAPRKMNGNGHAVPDGNRRALRVAAKKACRAATGNIENWRAYL